MKIDINKKYRTRDGREVTHLYKVPDGWPTKYPWRGLVDCDQESWTDEGLNMLTLVETPCDLVEVREPREWNIRVGINGNTVKGDGRIIAEQLQGDRTPGDSDTFEVIRVREIIG